MLKKQSGIFKALSDPSRLRILKMLQIKPLCVCEITEILGLAASTVSKHLTILKKAGFIEDFKDGKWINYSLKKAISEPEVYSLFSYLYFILENDLKIKEDRTKLGFVDRIEIKKR
ncbi:MAG: ArsR family transcriptional regulator [Chlorobi bacterium OLB5]|nr:MAG: ArsR family transcriptional regulator [Chlorobi bacterium OLB5]